MAAFEEPPEQRERAAAHDERRDQDAPQHGPVEDRLARIARRVGKLVALRPFAGEEDVLDAVRHQIEPEELHRQQRHRQAERQREQEQQDLRGAGRHEHEHDLADVGVGHAAGADAGDDRGEVVVGDDDVGALLGDVGALAPHGDADMGVLEGGRVVDAVAGDGDEMAVALERPDDGQLLDRLHPRVDAGRPRQRVERRFPGGLRLRHLLARDDLRLREVDSRLPRDGARGPRVVAGDHDDLDAGLPAGRNRPGHLRPQRVLHAGETEEIEVQQVPASVAPALLDADLALGEGEHAQATRRQLLLLRQQRRPVDRRRAAGDLHAVAHGDERFGRALDEDPDRLAVRVEGGGVFQVRLVGDARDERVLRLRLLVHDAGLARREQQRDVDGVADARPAVRAVQQRALVGHRRRMQQPGAARPRVARRGIGRIDPARLHVRPRLEQHGEAVRQADLRHRQLVHRQRTGLVGGDQRAGAERLDRRHVADDDVHLRHAPHADRQRHRDRDGQALGDRADGEAHGHQEQLVEAHVAGEADKHEHDHRYADRDRDRAGEGFQTDHQGRRGIGRPREQARDPADLRFPARGRDEAGGAAARHQRAGIGRSRRFGHGLRHRQGLARQQRFVALQVLALQQPQVGRDAPAGFDHDDVAGHQLARVDLVSFAGADHRRPRLLQPPKRRRRPAGRIFLDSADHAVDQKHDADEGGVADVAERHRDQRGRE